MNSLTGTPCVLRTDCGTDNTRLAFIQPFLRRDHLDCFAGSDSFRYGNAGERGVKTFQSRHSMHCMALWIPKVGVHDNNLCLLGREKPWDQKRYWKILYTSSDSYGIVAVSMITSRSDFNPVQQNRLLNSPITWGSTASMQSPKSFVTFTEIVRSYKWMNLAGTH